ncbi:MAG TPA: hypothetical protein VFW84_05495 [Aquabacterium sp.]|uniref:hypothetical protein n=1 Tax=Aquabacterium sp. TaxID=1872578 RepID=UPI002E33563B|nr:hypothetical protein [Aquabacterium sp.]HEX5372168.1 hypothetical protein [Aquabacterium sp.]
MLISRQAEAWIAARRPYPDELEWAAENNARMANSIRELPQTLPIICSTLSDVKINESAPNPHVLSSLEKVLNGVRTSIFSLYQVTCLVRFDDGDTTSPSGLLEAFSANQLEQAITTSVILAQIARPGSLGIAGGVVLVEDKVFSTIPRQWFFYEMHSGDFRRSKWPQIDDLQLTKLCVWAKELGAFSSAVARTRIQRTLAALTHAISLPSSQSGETLFRAMQGLEAFFSDGTGDLRRQLSEKSQIWLGPSGQSKNVVGHLYDLRSSYVHGSANLDYPFGLRDSYEEDKLTSKKLSEAVEFAIRLLIATIQRCAADRLFDLKWNYGYEAT